jgi:hypothetical protein
MKNNIKQAAIKSVIERLPEFPPAAKRKADEKRSIRRC